MGRFVQADSVIGDPTNSQAYNAYTYVLNNPLAYTDPSGHWGEQEQAYLRTVVAIVIAAYTGYYINVAGLSGASAYGVAALGGAAAGAVSSGNLRGAVTGAIGGALFYGVGTAFQHAEWAYTSQGTITTSGWAAKTVAHGFAGGIMAELEGDKFGHGFVSAGFTQSMSGVVGRVPNAGGRVVAAAVVGGTASRMSGGKFANGAVTAGFSYSFASGLAGWSGGFTPPAADVTDARLAMGVYDPNFHGADGYTVEQRFSGSSGLQAVLFRNGESRVLAFAGTDPSSWSNWRANLAQAFGFRSAQYEIGIDIATKLSRAYATLRFTGHSLGGGIASAAAIVTGGFATTFNAAGVHNNTLRGMSRSSGTIRAYHSTFDVLQMGNFLTPASVAGKRISLGPAGLHGMGGMCGAMGC